jgi:acetyltransferase-like isoleucine patch superfamily enzyme
MSPAPRTTPRIHGARLIAGVSSILLPASSNFSPSDSLQIVCSRVCRRRAMTVMSSCAHSRASGSHKHWHHSRGPSHVQSGYPTAATWWPLRYRMDLQVGSSFMRTWTRYLPAPIRRLGLDRNFEAWQHLQRIGRIQVGRGTYGVPLIRHFEHDEAKLVIGSFTSIAPLATIMLGGNHPTDRVTTYPLRIMLELPGAGKDGYPAPTGDTRIGSDVWICTEAFIGAGVTVGDGAVIAARAVVVHDVPPYAIVAGNPATVKRYRFTEAQRVALLRISWWDWSNGSIRDAVKMLADADIDEFIRQSSPSGPNADVLLGP